MAGPYFVGQQPSPCGHYYPEVLRLRDEKRKDGSLVRINRCKINVQSHITNNLEICDGIAWSGTMRSS